MLFADAPWSTLLGDSCLCVVVQSAVACHILDGPWLRMLNRGTIILDMTLNHASKRSALCKCESVAISSGKERHKRSRYRFRKEK
jgi:hypothetical protein